MPEMIKAGHLKVGDKFRVEATVTVVDDYTVYTDNGVKLRTYLEVELVERAMPKFEPGGILRYCHDPVKFPNIYVDWLVVADNMARRLGLYHSVYKSINPDPVNDDDANTLSVNTAPRNWTYFPPATANDNGTRLG